MKRNPRLLLGRSAYSTAFWAVVLGTTLVPIMALAIAVGRYFYAKAEVGKAADAAALAAAAQIDAQAFRTSSGLEHTAEAWAQAQSFASLNNGYLAAKGIHAFVTGISVDTGEDTVTVEVSANLSPLFPSVVPAITVHEMGKAKLRSFTR
ncbi:MAG: pilus assembly protein TadG-related protein [Chloroflexota bacterium]